MVAMLRSDSTFDLGTTAVALIGTKPPHDISPIQLLAISLLFHLLKLTLFIAVVTVAFALIQTCFMSLVKRESKIPDVLSAGSTVRFRRT